MERRLNCSCDLLENYYLCSINNSETVTSSILVDVVICLKTTTFVVSTTVRTFGVPFNPEL